MRCTSSTANWVHGLDVSAGLGLDYSAQSAKLRLYQASRHSALHALAVDGHVEVRLMEPATWSILVPPNTDRTEAVATACLLLRSLSLVWLAMRLLKTRSGQHKVTAPVRPNRNWRKPRTDITHVTMSLKGGCHFAAAFCVAVQNKMAHRLCTSGARAVHTNHTPIFEVSAC